MKEAKGHKYQYNFSQTHREVMYDIKMREQKAKKIIAVFDNYCPEKIGNLSVLDVGCSTGIISNYLSQKFARVIGIDIDEAAIEYARITWQSENLEFYVQDASDTKFPDNSFDIIICAHIYEHVPGLRQLLAEIKRMLKPGGVCYFAVANRLTIIEPHYKLPFLSIFPKPIGNLYLRFLKKQNFYYENLLTYWQLKRLVSQFEIIDYTSKIIKDPLKYNATEMIKPNSFKQKIAILITKVAYGFVPVYIWILRNK